MYLCSCCGGIVYTFVIFVKWIFKTKKKSPVPKKLCQTIEILCYMFLRLKKKNDSTFDPFRFVDSFPFFFVDN